VAPGQEYETVCDEIYQAVRSMVNPLNGKPCARAVYKTDDICNGPFRSHLPDVVMAWDPGARVTTELLTEKYGVVRAREPSCGVTPFYSGNHWPNAFAVALGPDVPRGVTLEPQDVLDLAPTILDRFGIQPPAHMKGRILNELRTGAARPLTD
jgi:predicted AlkP superfamily phosphohydrolase/phosphomutase